MFVVPPLLLTAPDAARGLLSFRYVRRHAAHTNAAMGGFPGLQYPWEASPSAGAEASPWEAAAPGLEHHVSMDVAVAFARYVHATGDVDFARGQAAPVLAGVADWLASRLDAEGDGVHFRRVNGVAETGVPVDDNAYVTMAAIRALREAAGLRHRLGEAVPPSWEWLADRLHLPTGRRDGTVVLNHAGYRRDEDKGATPEALAGFWPLDHRVDPGLEQRTTRYYLAMAGDYVGAPMLSATLGVHAARTGDRGAALEWFERGYAEFVVEPFTITTEFSPRVFPDQPVAGPFAANLGGFLSALVYGLPGIRLHGGEPARWCEREVVLPDGWDAVRVERLWARGRPVELVAEHGATRARLTG